MSGILSNAIDLVRATLADSDTFRGLTDPAMDQAGALARIHEEGLPPAAGDEYTLAELASYRPFAIVAFKPIDGFRISAAGWSGTQKDWSTRGQILVTIEKACPSADVSNNEPTAAAMTAWRDEIGGVIDDIADLAGQAGYINAEAITYAINAYAASPDDAPGEGVWLAAELEIEFTGVA